MPAVRRAAVFEEIETLPGAQHHPVLSAGDRQAGLRERGTNMRGHVVWAFNRMAVAFAGFGHQTLIEVAEVEHNVAVCILLDCQAAGSVLNKYGEQAIRR